MSTYRVIAVSPRTFRGSLAAVAPPVSIPAPPVATRQERDTRRSLTGTARPHAAPPLGGPTLEELQYSVAAVLKGLGTPPLLHTTDGHPIHLDLDPTDLAHHAMSPAGHRESSEALRQAVKLLLHLRDVKRDAGDARGALLFGREAEQHLQRMERHRDIVSHKEAMHEHAARAASHAANASALARQIAGKDHIGLADHEQARAHPAYARYAGERDAELRASEGVRHAALAAMGRAGAGAHGLELNRFLEQHGHGAHGITDSADARIDHDANKARLDKTLTGPPSTKPIPKLRPRISEIAARGGEARNEGGRQQRNPAPPHPGQLAGLPVARSITEPIRSPDTHAATGAMDAAATALEQGDHDTMLGHALRAMEHALGGHRGDRQPGNASTPQLHDPDDSSSLLKAQQQRPLRPDLSVIRHRPAVRSPGTRPSGERPLRRYPDGTLDYDGATHAILDVLWKLRDGAALTPLEGALAQLVLPGTSQPEALPVAVGRIAENERRHLVGAVLGKLAEISRAHVARSLAEVVRELTPPLVRERLPELLLIDPCGLGRARLLRALAPVDPGLAAAGRPRGGPGSRGGQVAYTTRSGRPVYASHARRLAPQMDRMMTNWHQRASQSGHPEDHAVAAKQALAAAFYHHHAGDPMAAEQAMDYADHHLEHARRRGHQGRTMRWIEQHHPATDHLVRQR